MVPVLKNRRLAANFLTRNRFHKSLRADRDQRGGTLLGTLLKGRLKPAINCWTDLCPPPSLPRIVPKLSERLSLNRLRLSGA